MTANIFWLHFDCAATLLHSGSVRNADFLMNVCIYAPVKYEVLITKLLNQ